jgi:hypothetical protein
MVLPSDRAVAIASTSSIKIMLGLFSLAILKSVLINFSLSPTYFDIRSLLLMLKNVLLHSVAQAFAKKVFPVPGGP